MVPQEADARVPLAAPLLDPQLYFRLLLNLFGR